MRERERDRGRERKRERERERRGEERRGEARRQEILFFLGSLPSSFGKQGDKVKNVFLKGEKVKALARRRLWAPAQPAAALGGHPPSAPQTSLCPRASL
jgi:hypothetical protein